MAKKKSALIKNVAVLLGVAFIAVLLLAVVNQVTREPIIQADINARNETYSKVFEDAETFEELKDFDSENIEDIASKSLEDAGITTCFISDAKAAVDKDGNKIGFVIDATSKSGYGGEVEVAVGISNDSKITGFSVISHSETPGLGARWADDENAVRFNDKDASAALGLNKTGNATDKEVDAISGATITSNAVCEATNAAIAFYNACLKGE